MGCSLDLVILADIISINRKEVEHALAVYLYAFGAFSSTFFRQLSTDVVLFFVLTSGLIFGLRSFFRPIGFLLFRFALMGYAASALLADKLDLELVGRKLRFLHE
jgi:hypothetical protein